MKIKLNRKGFTLVELLAVIIILSIVVGISIPAITSIINDSKNNALGVAVDAAADYLADQYAYMSIDYSVTTEEFRILYPSLIKTNGRDMNNYENSNDGKLIRQMGLGDKDVATVNAYIDETTGKVCVKIKYIYNTSEFYSTEYWEKSSYSNLRDNGYVPLYMPIEGSGVKNSNCD